jgi:acyl-CoA dehydrogenase
VTTLKKVTTAEIVFTEEQAQLLDIAESFCRDKSPIAAVRAQLDTVDGFEQGLWQEMAQLGWLGIAIPEEFGGSGLGIAEVVTIAEPMGRSLFATPFATTSLAAQLLLDAGTDAQQKAYLPRIAEGSITTIGSSEEHGDWNLSHIDCTATLDNDQLILAGTKTLVADASNADTFIITVKYQGSSALLLVDRSAIDDSAMTREVVLDQTRRSYRINLDGVSVPAANLLDVSKTAAALTRHHKLSCLLFAAEACGGIAGAMDVTLEYLKTRKQFERYIGSYQSLKHTMVDILTGLEAARSFLYHAATVIDDGEKGEIAVRMAKAQAGEVFSHAGDRAIQFHGGFGFTFECDAQLFRRRAFWTENQAGDAKYHRKRLAALLLD